MKTKNYKTTSLRSGVITLLLVIGMFTGWGITRQEYIEKLDVVQHKYNEVVNELAIMQYNYQTENEKSIRLSKELNRVSITLESINNTIADLKDEEYRLAYIGDFKLSHYCTEVYEHICGTGTGLTSTGTKVTAGRTVAVDPSVIPYGSQIYIEGYGWRIAEDCGGSVDGSHIDIAVETHTQAISMGMKTGGVWLLLK